MKHLHLQPAMILPAATSRLTQKPTRPTLVRPGETYAGQASCRYNVAELIGPIFPEAMATFRQWLIEQDREDERPVVLRMNTPGGMAEGVFEAAELVRRVAKKREVVVVADGYLCSAGYAIAAAATRITATPSTVVGSCGVIQTLVDESAAFKAAGLRIVPVATGAAKTHGVVGTPITDEVIAEVQRVIDELNLQFEKLLEASPRMTFAKARAAFDGRVHVGVHAKAHRFIDDVCLIEDELKRLSDKTPERFAHLRGSDAADRFDAILAKRSGGSYPSDASDLVRSRVAREYPELSAQAEAEYRRREDASRWKQLHS